METIIHTYGGGEILHKVFNAIAMLMNNGSHSVMRPLMIICLSMASVWAVARAFFSSPLETLLGRYFLPALAIVGISLVPTTRVCIHDEITDKYFKVDHVPFLLAQFSQIASSIGYSVTSNIEAVMTLPNDTRYNATGMVFGSENALDMSKYKIRNGDFARNLREFSKQCVFYDLLHGRYSMEDMQKSTDLWKLFSEKTSRVRMIDYVDPASNSPTKTSKLLTCQQAAQAMYPHLAWEKNYYLLQDIGKNLPTTFQALTSISREAEGLVGQQILLDFFRDGFDAKGFAKRRAQAQQQSTYQTLGSLASTSIVSMRTVIEALVYAAFIFVLPISLLPMGLRFISTWIWMVIWIQLWAPFFAILSYIMQCAAQAQADAIFYGLETDQQSLSFFTSVGLFELHQNTAAQAGYFSIFIPMISYAILQGGVSSFIHLASSIMSPAHSAAAAAASEQVTGNYSFGNTSLGQESFRNRTLLQNNMAPSLSSGYLTQTDAESSSVYGHDSNRLTQLNSSLRTQFSSDQNLSNSMSKAHQKAESYTHSKQNSLNESISNHARNYGDYTNYLSESENLAGNISSREAASVQESASYVKNAVESFASQHGMSERDTLDLFVRTPGIGVGGSFNDSNTSEETWNAAKNVIDSDSFQKHHQNLMDFSNSKSINSLNDEGRKFSSGLTQSLDTVNSAQVQHQDALSKLQQVSDNWSFTQTMSAQQRTALDQEFVDWLSNDKYANDGGFGKARDTILRGRQEEIDSLGQEFLSTKLHDIEKPSFSPEDTFNESSAAFLSEKQRIQDSFHFNDELVSKGNSLSTKFHDRKEEYSFLANDPFEGVNTTIQGAHERISGAQQVQSSNWENKHREYEFYSEAKKIRNYAGNAVRIVGNAAEGLIEEPVEGRRAGPFAIPPSLWHKNTEAMH